MAIFWSQQISGILQRLYRQCIGGCRLVISSSGAIGTLELPLVNEDNWNQLLLNLGYTVQFPVVAAFHPLVSSRSINDRTLLPSLPHLIGQITVLLIIDYGGQRFFAQLYEEIFDNGGYNDGSFNNDASDNGTSSALEVATDFTASTAALVLAITIIQLSSRLRYFTGSFHFAAVICWLLLR